MSFMIVVDVKLIYLAIFSISINISEFAYSSCMFSSRHERVRKEQQPGTGDRARDLLG